MAKKKKNKILEDHGDWLLIDISTPKHPNATMAIDTDVFNNHNEGRIYALVSTNNRYISARYHTLDGIKGVHNDVLKKDKKTEIDHIKHGTDNYIDNRRSNLRVVTKSQNCMNRAVRSDNTSGYSGVSFCQTTKKWIVSISFNGKKRRLGYFDNIDIAIGVRQQAEREYHGEYSFNNYKGEK